MKISMIGLCIVLMLGFEMVGFVQNLDAKVVKKEKLLEAKIKKKGYKADFVRISDKRSEWFNKTLPLSAKNSTHLSGQAIDILVGDMFISLISLTITATFKPSEMKKYVIIRSSDTF
jgi:hypothetical protein